jgi:ubiquinone biosynthesis protein
MAQPQTRNIGRLSEIAQVAVKHGFGYVFVRRRPWRRGDAGLDGSSQRGVHLREMLDELGPTFVKFGQLLSMRPDIVPPDIIVELRRLQDDVSPFRFEDVERVILEDLELPIERLFLEFEPRPIAAASIGQVHRAVLPNGERVVVKVQRPNAPRQIEADLGLLYQAARMAKERIRALDFIDPRALVDEFARQIRQELDYRREGRNAEVFSRNFAGDPRVRIPRVYWSYSRVRVLTLEHIEGVQLADVDPETFSMEERARLAELISQVWMTMVFRHGFFHGDPHPANILVLPERDALGLVDFGATGKLTGNDLERLTRLFIDAINENVEVMPRRLAELGVRYPRDREDEFVAELREVFDRYYGATMAEIDPLQVIREAFSLIYRLNLQLPTRFVLLDRVIATLASAGIELYPDFNVFEVARPYARELVIRRFAPRRLLTQGRKEAFALAAVVREMPFQVHDFLDEVRDGQLEVGFVHKGLDEFMQQMAVSFNRLVTGLIVAGSLVGATVLAIYAKNGPHFLGLHIVGIVGFGVAAALGLWLLVGVIRSGRL